MSSKKILETTSSICPECYREGKTTKLTADIIEEDQEIWMRKTCTKHGSFQEIISHDSTLYKKWMNYIITDQKVQHIQPTVLHEPTLYTDHLSHPNLTHLCITNRCNLRCTFCMTNAGNADYIYEPSLDQIQHLLRQAIDNKTDGFTALQITGGEPTLRDDLFIIIRMAKDVGFSHIQLHTNGITLSQNKQFCTRLKQEQLDTIYLHFPGVTQKTNPYIIHHKKAIKHLRAAGLKVVLVPTIMKTINLQEVGDIVRFALQHMDAIQGIQFQPISFCGGTPPKNKDDFRVDFIDIITEMEKEFQGNISRNDFYPASFIYPFTHIIHSAKLYNQFRITAHPRCGVVTYIFYEEGKPIPITRFIDVEQVIELIKKQRDIKGPLQMIRRGASIFTHIHNCIDTQQAPTGFNVQQLLSDVSMWKDKTTLDAKDYHSMFIGLRWFQDACNLDIERLKRCNIHSTTLEGIIPYCSYVGLGLGEKIIKHHSVPIKEWEKRSGKTLDEDVWNE